MGLKLNQTLTTEVADKRLHTCQLGAVIWRILEDTDKLGQEDMLKLLITVKADTMFSVTY